MNTKLAILAMTGLALAAGCNRGATNSSANKSATGNSAAAAPGAPAGGGTPVTSASLVGTWGQDNCTNTISFGADGTATSTTAKQENNRWSLDGSTVVITSPGQPDVRMPATISERGLHLSSGEGQTAVFARCPDAGGAAPAASEKNEAEAAEEAAE